MIKRSYFFLGVKGEFIKDYLNMVLNKKTNFCVRNGIFWFRASQTLMYQVKVQTLMEKFWGAAWNSDFKALRGEANAAGPGTTLH